MELNEVLNLTENKIKKDENQNHFNVCVVL